MTVKEMVKKHLEANGFDGLVQDYRECACLIDDLMPCEDELIGSCEAGHRVDVRTTEDTQENCPNCPDCTWHIVAGKREGKDG